jgi:hypothetical protein
MSTPTTSTGPATRREALRQEGRRRTRRGGLRAALAVVPLALLATGALVFQASSAAFTATTSTGSNSWTAGTVTLADLSSVTFTTGTMKPGFANRGTQCIDVAYTGTLAAQNIKMYLGHTANTLGGNLQLRVEVGNAACASASSWTDLISDGGGNAFNDLSTVASGHTQWSNGYDSGWAPSSSATRAFRFSWWIPDLGETHALATQTLLNGLQGLSTSATFTWEARNS